MLVRLGLHFNIRHIQFVTLSTPASTGTTTFKQRPLLLHTSIVKSNKQVKQQQQQSQ